MACRVLFRDKIVPVRVNSTLDCVSNWQRLRFVVMEDWLQTNLLKRLVAASVVNLGVNQHQITERVLTTETFRVLVFKIHCLHGHFLTGVTADTFLHFVKQRLCRAELTHRHLAVIGHNDRWHTNGKLR